MNFILEMIIGILVVFIRMAIEVPLIWLGEGVLCCVTLGRHQPRWDGYSDEHGGAFVLLSETSLWIGVATATGISLGIKFLFW